jgi:hypothetical protein
MDIDIIEILKKIDSANKKERRMMEERLKKMTRTIIDLTKKN